MNIICDSRYLVFPVSHRAQIKTLMFSNGGKLIFDLRLKLDYVNPDYEVYINVERFCPMKMEISCIPEIKLDIRKADKRLSGYPSKYRPVFHYTADCGWLNDPNGLVFYQGEYHLFYQHNPVGSIWENMHWGHAVSDDLVHWKELECALYPDETGAMFSGSAIVDRDNVTGLKENENDVLLLFYTAGGGKTELSRGKPFTQCLAYSTDGGKHFRKYGGNPILSHIIDENRDPKVIRYRQTGRYIMSLFLEDHRYALFASENLLNWEKIQEIILDGDSECPDFYPLPADPASAQEKWILSGASDHYIIGSFDGYHFEPETKTKRLHYGKNSYAAQTWSGTDQVDGRRLRIAWNTFDIAHECYNKSMTFPCEMSLVSHGGEDFLCAYPAREIEGIHADTVTFRKIQVTDEKPLKARLNGRAYDMDFHFSNAGHSEFQIKMFGLSIYINTREHFLQCLDDKAPLESSNGSFELRLLVDTTGITIFVNKGKVYLSDGFIMDYNLNELGIYPEKSSFILEESSISEIRL